MEQRSELFDLLRGEGAAPGALAPHEEIEELRLVGDDCRAVCGRGERCCVREDLCGGIGVEDAGVYGERLAKGLLGEMRELCGLRERLLSRRLVPEVSDHSQGAVRGLVRCVARARGAVPDDLQGEGRAQGGVVDEVRKRGLSLARADAVEDHAFPGPVVDEERARVGEQHVVELHDVAVGAHALLDEDECASRENTVEPERRARLQDGLARHELRLDRPPGSVLEEVDEHPAVLERKFMC